MGCYRSATADDPNTFISAVSAVLQQFSPQIVQHVCDPRTGLPRTLKWPPSVSEVYEACREYGAELARNKRYQNFGEDRERMKDQGLLPRPVEVRPTREELRAKYGENWGLGDVSMRSSNSTKPAFKAPTMEEIAAHYAEYPMKATPRDNISYPDPEPGRELRGGEVFDEGADF